LYDTLNNITATVSEKTMGSVLGNADSLCVILLSTGDSIVLSKNFGVVKFPVNGGGYFRLYGIEGNVSIGERLAGFMDFFNFNVGDSFVYYVATYNPENYGPPQRWYYSITSKAVFPDGYVYEINGEYCEMSMTCGIPTIFNGFLCFKDSCFMYPPAFWYWEAGQVHKDYYDSYSYKLVMNPNTGKYCYLKRYKINNDDYIEFNPHSLCTLYNNSQIYNEDILTTDSSQINTTYYPCGSGNDINIYISRSGVGIVKQIFCTFENEYIMDLLFCIVQGDTLIDQLVNDENPEFKIPEPAIFPNPAQNNVNISHGIQFNNATIYSTSGKKVNDIILRGDKTEVDISGLNPGMYFVILEGKKRTTLKFVVE